MSAERTKARPIRSVQPPQTDLLARLDSDDVLRCRDPETDWLWFYDTDADGSTLCYHEHEGYRPRPTPHTIVAYTAALKGVKSHVVPQAHLDVRTGETDG